MRKRTIENGCVVDAKTGRIDEACARYGVGRNTMRKIAADANAAIKIGKNYLINFSVVDAYMDALSGESK